MRPRHGGPDEPAGSLTGPRGECEVGKSTTNNVQLI